MENGAAAYLKRAIVQIIQSSPILSKLLLQSEELQHDIDLEHQYTCLPTNAYSDNHQNRSSPSDETSVSQNRDTLKDYVPSEDPDMRIDPPDETTRVMLHDNGVQKRLAILVTEDLVFRTQKVINQAEKLQFWEKSHRRIEKEIIAAESQIEQIKAKLEALPLEEEAEDLRTELKSQEDLLLQIDERQRNSDEDLVIYRENLALAMDASHVFVVDLLSNAELLKLPKPEPEPGPEQETNVAELNDSDEPGPKTESVAMDVEGLLHQRVKTELGEASNELDEAERIFNNLDNMYEQEAEEYEAEVAKGDFYLARSEFDRMFLANNMAATTRLIQAQKVFKAKKRQAKALGVVGSTWGDDFDYGPYEAPSVTSEEMREYQTSRDWGFVENWVEELSALEPFPTSESQPEETEVDDWDARLGDMWESVSAVDHREESRDNMGLWDGIRESRLEDTTMIDRRVPEDEDDLSVPEQDMSSEEEGQAEEDLLPPMEE
ncbi:hypothetical protein P7C71_g4012, partial [Lecanoromycetidae sp. Uapishka_2]